MDPRALLLLLLLAVAEPALTQRAADDAATAFGAAPSRPTAFHRAAKVSSGPGEGKGRIVRLPATGRALVRVSLPAGGVAAARALRGAAAGGQR